MAWKLIVATEAPWTGELYHARLGHQRLKFNTVESFCSAVLATTGWPLHVSSGGGAEQPPPTITRQRRSGRSEMLSCKRKFIVAAQEPWAGHVYRTQPGLGHLHFATFEQFLRAVLDITSWSLDGATGGQHDEYAVSGHRLSRPVSVP